MKSKTTAEFFENFFDKSYYGGMIFVVPIAVVCAIIAWEPDPLPAPTSFREEPLPTISYEMPKTVDSYEGALWAMRLTQAGRVDVRGREACIGLCKVAKATAKARKEAAVKAAVKAAAEAKASFIENCKSKGCPDYEEHRYYRRRVAPSCYSDCGSRWKSWRDEERLDYSHCLQRCKLEGEIIREIRWSHKCRECSHSKDYGVGGL